MSLKKVFKPLSIILLFLFCSLQAWSTHNRAGELIYRYVGNGTTLTYEFTVITYTKVSPPSGEADRPRIGIDYGDGSTDSLERVSQVLLEGSLDDQTDIYKNEYVGIHTYSGPFTYVVTFTDPNRVEDVINIGTSVDIPFSVSDTLKILDPNFFGTNSSPILLQPPIDNAAIGIPFLHNPNAFDIDGDSLTYELIDPQQAPGIQVPGYNFPNEIGPGPNNNITIDQYTGEITWDSPQVVGLYNIAILIREFRNGRCIGTLIRDMQVRVEDTPNSPPVIEGPREICIIAGETLEFTVTASDPDNGQLVELTAAGSPFEVPLSSATFDEPTPGNPVFGDFQWETICDHLRANNYQVIFRAVDNFEDFPLSAILTTVIRVLAPPPEDLIGTYNAVSDVVELDWADDYACSDFDQFQGYQVWRKIGCEGDPQDSCADDLAARGYVLLGETLETEFTDTDWVRGNEYSYRVVARFAELSNVGGIELNPFEGYPSEEFCIEFPADWPVMYHADVRATDETNGVIYVEWSKPRVPDLDTITSPGPYKFELQRADGINGTNFTTIATFNSTSFVGLNDTAFTDVGLNTVANAYRYKVDFYVAGDNLLGSADPASSVFLNIRTRNEGLLLTWDYDVPWINDTFHIYRQDFNEGSFVLLDTTTEATYRDEPLINDSSYCYYIKAIGAYTGTGYKEPLINLSQEVCAIPNDTIPPCLVDSLVVDNFCTNSSLRDDEFINYLEWEFGVDCPEIDDIIAYYIFYSPTQSGELTIIDTTTIKEYAHILPDTSLTGCYAIQAEDEAGNLGPISAKVCMEDCPQYVLPTAFTPNDDNQNDIYTPIKPYRLVVRVDMQIFNRWGELVFETEDPEIKWDGVDMKTGKELDTAIFYYVCKVFINSLDGVRGLSEPLSGYIHLYR
ncbi:MAG: gliding motility-associated C-terminal domain-containing protein [Bacteroidetes bacterium]|nr:gliding motility-associated C-terminal domain-containing protein [Bacteroidota bacterium]